MDNYEVLDDDATTLETEADARADQGDFDLYDGCKADASADTGDEPVTEEAVTLLDGSEQIDDPVRMYLMQMGEIPLLTRPQEIAAAQQIEWTRARFRNTMLASDYLLQGAATLLR